MDVRMKASRDLSPERAKVPMQPRQKQMKKVQVVYYLSRGGQLEHPHFMEVLLPCNQELRLRDVMDRLNLLRGKGMPSLFSWSCKRSYKSGYVWNDLSEDDIICPADGVEYVLKGSELFEGCSEKYQETTSSKTSNTKQALEGPMGVYSQDRTLSNAKFVAPKGRIMIEPAAENLHEPVRVHYGLLPSKLPFAHQNATASQPRVISREEDIGNISTRSEPPHYRPRLEEKPPKPCLSVNREYKVFKSEPIHSTVTHGADAATQTSEDFRSGGSAQGEEAEEASKESECTQNSTELSGGEESPQSSSSISSAAEAHNEEAHETPKIKKSVRFEEPNSNQASGRFSLLQFISCGSMGVEDKNILMVPHKPARLAGAENSSNKNQPRNNAANTTLEEELDCMAEDLRIANAQRAEKQYFSGSIVEMKAHVEAEAEADPTLTKSASYDAQRGSKSEMGGVVEKERDQSTTRTKCLPRRKASKKEAQRNNKGSWSNRFP